jgi:lysine 6-dehydrogenase
MAGGTVLVLGIGIQGRAVLEDLDRRSSVDRVIAVDNDRHRLGKWLASMAPSKTEPRTMDAGDATALRDLMSNGVDIVIDMLPVRYEALVARAAIDAGVHLVNTNYGHALRLLDSEADDRGIVIMPEAGFDPGIDLVVAAQATGELDEVSVLDSYGAGIPAPDCRHTNAINYKVSWSFEGALRSYRRAARLLVDGKSVEIPAGELFLPRWTHTVDVDGVGTLEAYANGDAREFVDLLGLAGTVRRSGRYSLRWPGHLEFWSRMSALGFLDEAPLDGVGVSPREFLLRHLEPRLHYSSNESDMVMMRIDVAGTSGGRLAARRWELVMFREPGSELLAMSRAVGYPASVVAQMILSGDIRRPGVGSPVRDVPATPFLRALCERGIEVSCTELEPTSFFGR